MTKILHMIKKFELLKNLNKKLILVKNIYLAKFLVKIGLNYFIFFKITCVIFTYLFCNSCNY